MRERARRIYHIFACKERTIDCLRCSIFTRASIEGRTRRLGTLLSCHVRKNSVSSLKQHSFRLLAHPVGYSRCHCRICHIIREYGQRVNNQSKQGREKKVYDPIYTYLTIYIQTDAICYYECASPRVHHNDVVATRPRHGSVSENSH